MTTRTLRPGWSKAWKRLHPRRYEETEWDDETEVLRQSGMRKYRHQLDGELYDSLTDEFYDDRPDDF